MARNECYSVGKLEQTCAPNSIVWFDEINDGSGNSGSELSDAPNMVSNPVEFATSPQEENDEYFRQGTSKN